MAHIPARSVTHGDAVNVREMARRRDIIRDWGRTRLKGAVGERRDVPAIEGRPTRSLI